MKRGVGCCLIMGTVLGCIPLFSAAGGMKTSITLGGTLTDGNSESRQANVAIVTEGERAALGAIRVGAEANYGESTVDETTETTVENGKLYGEVRKTLSEFSFTYLTGSLLYDDMAAIDYRATVGPGFGLYLVKRDAVSFSVEAGAGYIWEDVGEVEDDYMVCRAAERLDWNISERSKIWQTVEYLPKAEEFDIYLMNAEVGIEAALNGSMSLRVVLKQRYDSEPAAGLEKGDTTLIAGITVKL